MHVEEEIGFVLVPIRFLIEEDVSEIPETRLYPSFAYIRDSIGNNHVVAEVSEDLAMQPYLVKRNGYSYLRGLRITDLVFGNWEMEFDPTYPNAIREELCREMHDAHPLQHIAHRLRQTWTRLDCDDELFFDPKTKKCYMVHLTWSKAPESPGFPGFNEYENMEDWVRRELKPEAEATYA